ncbi:unnamed protein product, partial [Polarella glacialis]
LKGGQLQSPHRTAPRPRHLPPLNPRRQPEQQPRSRLHQEVQDLSRVVCEEHLGHGSVGLELLAARMREGCDIQAAELQLAWSVPRGLPRAEAMKRLVRRFEALGLRDEWLAAVIGVLDRARLAGCACDATDLWAAALLIMKHEEAENEVGILRDTVARLAGVDELAPSDANQEFWNRVMAREIRLCVSLDFRLAVPTSLDLARSPTLSSLLSSLLLLLLSLLVLSLLLWSLLLLWLLLLWLLWLLLLFRSCRHHPFVLQTWFA